MRKTKATQLHTKEQARAALDLKGLSIADFARNHGLTYATVYQVLIGKKKGRRGAAHKAAVLLGMKHGVVLPDAKTDA